MFSHLLCTQVPALSHWHLSTTLCSEPCLCLLNHSTSHWVGVGIAKNLVHLWKQSLGPKRWPGPVSDLCDTGGSEKSTELLLLRVPEVLQPSLLAVLRSSQVCSNRCLNCCSSEADNESLTRYSERPDLLDVLRLRLILTASKQHLLFWLLHTSGHLKTRLQCLSRHTPLPTVSQKSARCPLSVFQKWITPINVP